MHSFLFGFFKFLVFFNYIKMRNRLYNLTYLPIKIILILPKTRQKRAWDKQMHGSHTGSLQEFPAPPHSPVKTQSNPCLVGHINRLVQHGQPSTSQWFPSAVNVHGQSSVSWSRHLPPSSTVSLQVDPRTQRAKGDWTKRQTVLNWQVASLISKGMYRWVALRWVDLHTCLL